MNLIEILEDENYKLLDQFERRDILKDFILKDNQCVIGNKVICFELENIKNILERHDRKSTIIKHLTIGKDYNIIDFKDGKIKILDDNNKLKWYTIRRFLYLPIKMVRREKLIKLTKYMLNNSSKHNFDKNINNIIKIRNFKILDKIPLEYIIDYMKNIKDEKV